MSRTSIPGAEIEHERRQACTAKHRSVAFVELITTAALALSTAIAATAVSIGIARAEISATTGSSESPKFAVVLVIALLFWGVAVLSATMAVGRRAN
jgi:hypothetical protein